MDTDNGMKEQAISPAPMPPRTDSANTLEPEQIVTLQNYEEQIYSTRTDNNGRTSFQTPKLFGYLHNFKFRTSMPIRVVIRNALSTEEILYNNHITTNDTAYVRHRTKDQHGQYYDNVVDKILLNNPLIIEFYGSKNKEVITKIVMTKP